MVDRVLSLSSVKCQEIYIYGYIYIYIYGRVGKCLWHAKCYHSISLIFLGALSAEDKTHRGDHQSSNGVYLWAGKLQLIFVGFILFSTNKKRICITFFIQKERWIFISSRFSCNSELGFSLLASLKANTSWEQKSKSPGKYWSVAKWTRDISSHLSKGFLQTPKDLLLLYLWISYLKTHFKTDLNAQR